MVPGLTTGVGKRLEGNNINIFTNKTPVERLKETSVTTNIDSSMDKSPLAKRSKKQRPKHRPKYCDHCCRVGELELDNERTKGK